ncbi:Hsp20/alpha crystallin family protein [Endothiovibrio diazotrophicus]
MFGYMTGREGDFFDRFERVRREVDEVDRLFGGWPTISGIRSVAADTFPALNVGVSPEQIDVYLFVTGVDPEHLDISLQQNLLSVVGERLVAYPEEGHVYRRDRFGGAFRRVVNLPEDVDPEQVGAVYRDGVLHITVQRRDQVKPRRIEIGQATDK